MIEPTLALQTAIRTALVAAPSVTALVSPDNINSGTTRPDKLPSILMANGQTIFLGNAAGSQYLARVFVDVHFWAIDDGAGAAKAIGFAASEVLKKAPGADGFEIDYWELPAIRWMRDPNPALNYAHGVMTIEAVVRWSI